MSVTYINGLASLLVTCLLKFCPNLLSAWCLERRSAADKQITLLLSQVNHLNVQLPHCGFGIYSILY